ncbi:PIN domain-containing protein [Aquibacillus halophilus]|uniref:PIN domain-containing protein n=1 Tax=Aquibacillus halophilus TaxID=930132 RepID=UPI0014794ED7
MKSNEKKLFNSFKEDILINYIQDYLNFHLNLEATVEKETDDYFRAYTSQGVTLAILLELPSYNLFITKRGNEVTFPERPLIFDFHLYTRGREIYINRYIQLRFNTSLNYMVSSSKENHVTVIAVDGRRFELVLDSKGIFLKDEETQVIPSLNIQKTFKKTQMEDEVETAEQTHQINSKEKGQPEQKKTYREFLEKGYYFAFDTNVLMDYNPFEYLKKEKIIISKIVLLELDGLKRDRNKRSKARRALRNIRRSQENNKNIEIAPYKPEMISKFRLSSTSTDDQIIASYLDFNVQDKEVVYLSGDNGSLIIAENAGLLARNCNMLLKGKEAENI